MMQSQFHCTLLSNKFLVTFSVLSLDRLHFYLNTAEIFYLLRRTSSFLRLALSIKQHVKALGRTCLETFLTEFY